MFAYPLQLAVAAALSIVGAMLLALLPVWLGGITSLQLVIAGVLSAYLGFVLVQARGRAGRLVAATVWGLVVAGSLTLLEPLACVVLWLVLISTMRTVFWHPGAMSWLLDLLLVLLGAGFALWAQPVSNALALWCFFLTQSLALWLPGGTRRRLNHDFVSASMQAERALRALAHQSSRSGVEQ